MTYFVRQVNGKIRPNLVSSLITRRMNENGDFQFKNQLLAIIEDMIAVAFEWIESNVTLKVDASQMMGRLRPLAKTV